MQGFQIFLRTWRQAIGWFVFVAFGSHGWWLPSSILWKSRPYHPCGSTAMFRRWIRLVADRPLSRHRRLDVDADRASNVVDRAFFHRRSIDASEVAFIRNTWSRRQSEPDPPVFPTRHPVATKRRLWKKRLQTSSKEHVFLARRGRSEATFVRFFFSVFKLGRGRGMCGRSAIAPGSRPFDLRSKEGRRRGPFLCHRT